MTATTLYDYWRSSASYRVRIALNLAGIEFRARSVDLYTGENRQAGFLDINPQGLVPVLELDGMRFSQSLAIIEYLHEAGYRSFLPESILGRYRVRRLAYAIAMEIHPVCNLSVSQYVSRNSGDSISVKGWMHEFLPRGLKAFENMLSDRETGRYCHGDDITMVDICLVPQIYNANRWQVPLNEYPQIRDIVARLEQLPAFAASHPDRFRKEQ